MSENAAPTREIVRDLALLVGTKAIAAAVLLSRGFSHVSDDDFSRVVIAEKFAHAPALDPSGTSWLPFPFWLTGSAMMIFGRSLATARGVAIVLGCLAPCLVYAALRVARVQNAVLLALAAMLGPWASWLSVATVPEIPTAALASAGAIVLTRDAPVDRADTWAATALCFACLSRYEAWPIAGACAVVITLRASKYGFSRVAGIAMAVTVIAPLAWMMWNAHAHGDALHFFTRVSRFREHAGASADVAEGLAFYPRVLLTDTLDATLLLPIVVFVLARRAEFRARWRGPLLACAATFAFLVVGAIKDGAPTHHPARALVIVFPVVIAAGLDAVRELASSPGKPRLDVVGLAMSITMIAAWLVTVHPATTAAEQRHAQIARGNALRDAHAAHVTVHPCAFEHFALIAAFGAPERVNIVEPSARTTPTDACPALENDSM